MKVQPLIALVFAGAALAADLPPLELVHVLADSGEHSDEAASLMREDTAPANTRLTAAQCARIVANAAREGLLRKAPTP